MFEDWHPAAQVDNTPESAQAVRRMFELHLLPQVGALRVLDAKPEHVRKAVKALIHAGKVPTAKGVLCVSHVMEGQDTTRWKYFFDTLRIAERMDEIRGAR